MWRRGAALLAFAVTAAGCGGSSNTLLDVSASGTLARTSSFLAPPTWTLRFAFDCRHAAIPVSATEFAIIAIDDARTGQPAGPDHLIDDAPGYAKKDVATFPVSVGGELYLAVSSYPGCAWHLTVPK